MWKEMERPGCSEVSLGEGRAYRPGEAWPLAPTLGRRNSRGDSTGRGRQQRQVGWPHSGGLPGRVQPLEPWSRPRLKILEAPSLPGASGWAARTLSVLFLQETKLNRKTPETRARREPFTCAEPGKGLFL